MSAALLAARSASTLARGSLRLQDAAEILVPDRESGPRRRGELHCRFGLVEVPPRDAGLKIGDRLEPRQQEARHPAARAPPSSGQVADCVSIARARPGTVAACPPGRGRRPRAGSPASADAHQGRKFAPGDRPVRSARVRGRRAPGRCATCARAISAGDDAPASTRRCSRGVSRVQSGDLRIVNLNAPLSARAR